MATSKSDQDIRQNVWNSISHDVRIDSTDLSVDVKDGVVYLNGSVSTYSQQVTAAQDARRIKRVVDVVNKITVQLPRIWTNPEIRDAIRSKLDRDARIGDPNAIQISMDGGVVTLTGTVPNYAVKAAAGDDAWTAPGVVDVNNGIIIAPVLRRSDAEIQADVRRALDEDPSIAAPGISVTVINGVVYVRGAVPTYYQIERATIDGWSVPGVVDVVNELSVS